MMSSKRPGVTDVAREAGVSTATVSRVLNDSGQVRDETRESVLRAIARLHYTPNLYARTLAGGDSRTIGMIVSNLENPFFLDIYRSLEAEAQRVGHEVLVASTGYDPERLSAAIGLMLGRRVTGIAAVVSEMTPAHAAELNRSGLPVVVYDVTASGRQIVNVLVDYASGMREMIELLYSTGHRHFAFVGHHTTLGPLSARLVAFNDQMHQYGRRVKYQVVTETDALDGGYRAGHLLLAGDPTPTAIVCVNDLMASGVLRALRERGLRVPEDVSVTGFDNVTLAEYVSPPLTTVDVPRLAIGQLVVDRLVLQPVATQRQKRDREVIITPRMIVRGSTGPARKHRI
jgi:DNA-binding LacI/PurR family transcriptional regulator